jgi:hypothetical protein
MEKAGNNIPPLRVSSSGGLSISEGKTADATTSLQEARHTQATSEKPNIPASPHLEQHKDPTQTLAKLGAIQRSLSASLESKPPSKPKIVQEMDALLAEIEAMRGEGPEKKDVKTLE